MSQGFPQAVAPLGALAVRAIVEAGPAKIKWLMELGTHFTTRGEIGENNEETKKDEFHLGREGGHHKRRVIHAGDTQREGKGVRTKRDSGQQPIAASSKVMVTSVRNFNVSPTGGQGLSGLGQEWKSSDAGL